ncbi:nucleoside recognition domain-containing protein [Aureibacillus halotolerans]|uniref:Spore maturation protein A n=1 Tax=Aureibacillus halotolerans TaxID=1508390 RepID=A0A4R6U513_9BACI|nr:nucleoside recognition domain-containing protein [Aureibacillus halotolerans]TDQ41580.1 spore maturation protein A [Aureibacillus halotolerans]
MVNYIWVALTVIGLVYAAITGTIDEVNKAVFEGAEQAVVLSIGLISVLVFWLGLMKVAEEAGLLAGLAKLCRPLMSRLFPDIPKQHPAMGYILSNMTANLFGLGNAATPLGIKAMEQMKLLHGSQPTASRSMITFLAINTSSVTLVPTTVIAIRMTYHSESPTEIVGVTLAATLISLISAILIDRYFAHRRMRR